MPAEASRPAESPSLDAKLALIDSETESDDKVPKINTGDQDEGHAGPNPGIQDKGQARPNPSQLDEEFTTTVYPNVQENLKMPSEDSVIPEEHASSTGTLSSLQNLEKELSFINQFFVEKKQEEEPGKTNAELEVSKAVDEIVIDAVDWTMQAPLRARFSDLPTVDMKETLQQRMFVSNSYEAHGDHKKLYDTLEKSLERDYSDQLLSDLEEAPGASGALGTSEALGSSQLPLPPPPLYTSTSRFTQLQGSKAPTGLYGTQELSPMDSLILNDSIPDKQVHFSDDEDSENDHLPTTDLRKGWWKPLPAEERPATPESTWTIPSSNMSLIFSSIWKNVTSCSQISKGSSPALSIFKMKAASYPDFGLELLVPEQMWIEDVCTNDISAKYDYLSKVVLRRADLQEYTIAKKYFKNLHLSDFKDLNLLLLQDHLDHLPGSDKKMLSTAVKLWTRNLVIQQRVEDF
nr:hypothetical protein [Tanacetum cinerariifolium]